MSEKLENQQLLQEEIEFENPEEEFASRSQWQLFKIKFKRNKLAVAGIIALILLYLIVLCADFIAPYSMSERYVPYKYAPPTKIHFTDEDGLSWPYVYQMTRKLDIEKGRVVWTEVKDKKYYVKFFTRGDEYRFLYLFETDLHLFGTEEGARINLLGADKKGRDVFTRLLQGGKVSLSAGLLGVIISLVIGSVMGAVSGYYSGKVDLIIQRIIEFMSSFPRVPIWLAISAALPPSWSSIKIYMGVVTLLGLVGWGGLARAVRAKILAYRESDYVLAAEAGGADSWWIMIRHLIPNVMSHIIVTATLMIPRMILGESTLSFLGVGIQPPMTSWGVMLQEAQNIQSIALRPWLLIPGLAIFVAVLSYNFLGDGLRDAADPYSNV